MFATLGNVAPSIAYVGVASDDDREFFKWLTAFFRQSGSGPVTLAPLASPTADLDEARQILTVSDVIFMSGGDVEGGMQTLQERGLLPFLRRLHAQGKPFLGLSAGSIMLARCWVRWPDPQNDAVSEIFPCMNLAPVLCDTHAEAEDWEELKALLRLSAPSSLGYGIPSGGGLRIDPDGSVSALGHPVPRFHRVGHRIVPLSPLLPPS
jgi:cyanophycinase-like exopeptidase